MTSTLQTKKPACILFTHYGDNWIRGSERCLLDLLSHLNKDKFTIVLWCNQEILATEAKKLGVIVYLSPFPLLFGWNKPHFNFSAFFGLIKQAKVLIAKHQVQLIHANSAAPCQWLNFAARKCNIPLICHLHSIYQRRDRLTLGLYQVSMAVGVSRYVLNDLQKDKMPAASTCVIANGIDCQKRLSDKNVMLRKSLAICRTDFVIATVGSLIERKGIDLIITAAAKLIAKKVPLHLFIIGTGKQEATLRKQIRTLGLQQHITLLGEQKNVHGILKGNVDLFVSAAREEAFGLVLAEAGLAKLAVVAPDVGGISEVIVDGQTGILIPPQDVDALSEAIYKLYRDPDRRTALGEAGYQQTLKNFSIETNCQQFEHLYQKMLHVPHSPKPWYKDWSLNLSLNSVCKRLFVRGEVNEA